jgi:hypothetical protein
MKYQRLTLSVILVFPNYKIIHSQEIRLSHLLTTFGPADVPSTFLPYANERGSDPHKSLSSFAGLPPHSSANEEKDETMDSLLVGMAPAW